MTFIYAFLPLCLLAYYLARSLKVRNYVLLFASMLFYGLGEPVYILMMLVAAGSAYMLAARIDKYRGTRKSRLFLGASVMINVSFLFFFKYVPLFIQTVSALLRVELWVPREMLPIGISFYTFQILTYTIDVYFGKTRLQPSPLNFLLFVSMFPQLIAGPIVRYDDVARQLEKRYVNFERFAAGVVRFICGLAKKVLLADYAGMLADKLLGAAAGGVAYAGVESVQIAGWIREGLGMAGGLQNGAARVMPGGAAGGMLGRMIGEIMGGEAGGVGAGVLSGGAAGLAGAGGGISTLGAWIGILLFGFQIYFDFSGYSDMAIGLGRMFGFEFMENFKHPYSSKSVTEFWRRWHISLGTFFRDYVYIPLGGNRRFQLRNIVVVWVLTGLWHGASWNFVIWGCYFGLLLLLEKYVFSLIHIKAPTIIRWAYCFCAVFIGWCVFYFADLPRIWDTIGAMFKYRPETDFQIIGLVRENLFFIAVCLVASMPWAKQAYDRIMDWGGRRNGYVAAAAGPALAFFYTAVLLFACSAARVSSSYSAFLYFRF